MAELLGLCRFVVAITFLLSAAWKLRHRVDFSVVIASSSWRLSGRWRTALGPAVALLEIIIGAGLLLFPRSWPLGLVAALFLVVFSAFLARAGSLANGCGCWRPVKRGSGSARPYLIRNAILIVLAGAGAAQLYRIGTGPEIALIAVALLPAWLVMEIPTFAELLSPPARPSSLARAGGKS